MICERCKKETKVFTCSMFNTENICVACKKEETLRLYYKYACDVELEHVKRGDYNFKGIGLFPIERSKS